MHENICYIFGAGDHYEPPPRPDTGDFVIAADGGYAYLESRNIAADLFVGDFDSYKIIPENTKTVTLPQMKNETDTRAALRLGFDLGYRLFHIFGGTGGRLDHTLANIQCLAHLARRGGRGFLFDKDSVITAIRNGAISFRADAFGTVSVFACGSASGVNETGLKYSLSEAFLRNTAPVGVSNELIGKPAEISVRKGTLIVIFPKNAFAQ